MAKTALALAATANLAREASASLARLLLPGATRAPTRRGASGLAFKTAAVGLALDLTATAGPALASTATTGLDGIGIATVGLAWPAMVGLGGIGIATVGLAWPATGGLGATAGLGIGGKLLKEGVRLGRISGSAKRSLGNGSGPS
jgi:hypothetical protein